MRLAETDASVNEQRVVRIAGLIRHGEGSSVSKLVRGTYDKIIKSESEVSVEHERPFSRTDMERRRMRNEKRHEEHLRNTLWALAKSFPRARL
jgi:hypothetical protein